MARLRNVRVVRAARSRVQGHLVEVHQVDGLDDVDFAIVRPEGALRPESRPHRAAERDVCEVDDPEGAVVVEILARYSDL